MKSSILRSLLCLILLCPLLAQASEAFSFGVIARPAHAATATTLLRKAIDETDADNLAFVVANGIKADDESCTDDLYNERHALYESAKNGLIVSPTSGDWADCVNAMKQSIAIERLRRLRELFFVGEFSFGQSQIPLIRQSTIPTFRMYAENMHWRIGDVLFATINLPSNNNNFQNAAGRNSEYEDRQVANNDWLKRLFITAKASRLNGIVLFCDGNPMAAHEEHDSGIFFGGKRGGYAEIRHHILKSAATFQGRILIVHAEQDAHPAKGILWRDNVGTLRAAAPWTKIKVNPAQPQLFAVVTPAVASITGHNASTP